MNDFEPQHVNIGVIGKHIHTTVTLQDGSRLRILMNEKTVAEVVLAYRDALAKLRSQSGGRSSPSKDADNAKND